MEISGRSLQSPDQLGEDDRLEDGGEDADVADEHADHHGREAKDEGEVDKEASGLAGLWQVGQDGNHGHQQHPPI